MAEDRTHHTHHFKLLLALVLIVGIVGLLAYTNSEGNFLQNLKIGRFSSVEPPESQPFNIVLTTEATALYGNSFSLSNSIVTLSGICNSIQVGGLPIEKDETRCSIETNNFTGSFIYSQFGSVSLSGKSTSLKIDSFRFTPSTTVNFEVEVIPMGFSVNGVSKDKLSLVAPSGKIEKYTKGELKTVSYLSKSSIDITDLFGNVELNEGTLKITSSTTSVKSEEFSW